MNLFNFVLTTGGDAGNGANPTGGMLSMVIWLVVMVAAFYFFLFRPQKKREKEVKQLQDSLQIGDEIVTNGGSVGIVVSIKEDTVVIETGSDRSKVRIKRWAIASNETIHDANK